MRNVMNLINTKSFVSVDLLSRMIYVYIKCDCKPFPNTCKPQFSKISGNALSINNSIT